MKIKTTTVTRLLLTELVNLDPVEVIADNIAEHKGKVTMTCYDQSWTAYWGSTGCDCVEEFFCGAGNDYLIGCFTPMLYPVMPDPDSDGMFIKSKILEARRKSEISQSEAADLWTTVNMLRPDRNSITHGTPKNLALFLGEEPWYLDWPTMRNPDYAYLSRICDAVKEAFKQVKEQKHD